MFVIDDPTHQPPLRNTEKVSTGPAASPAEAVASNAKVSAVLLNAMYRRQRGMAARGSVGLQPSWSGLSRPIESVSADANDTHKR